MIFLLFSYLYFTSSFPLSFRVGPPCGPITPRSSRSTASILRLGFDCGGELNSQALTKNTVISGITHYSYSQLLNWLLDQRSDSSYYLPKYELAFPDQTPSVIGQIQSLMKRFHSHVIEYDFHLILKKKETRNNSISGDVADS